MSKKGLKLPEIILAILIVFTFVALIVDVIKGPGSFSRHFLIDGRFLFAVIAVIIFVSDLTKSKLIKFFSEVFALISVPLFVIYIILLFAEASNYENYVLSVYGIHLNSLILLPIFSILIGLLGRAKTNIKIRINLANFLFLFSATLIIFYIIVNLSAVINSSLTDDVYILTHLNLTYDQKMEYSWGDYYDYMLFVRNNTPEDARIIIPPDMNPWTARTADTYLDRAFLYPRTLIQYHGLTIPEEKNSADEYIMISWGLRDCNTAECHGWPKQRIYAKKIFYKDPKSPNVIETKQSLYYTKDDYKYVYGLIEL